MQRISLADATDLLEQGAALLMPFREIRRAFCLLSTAWKDQIGNLEIADGAVVGRGLLVELPCNAEGGFAKLPAGAGVSGDGGEELIAVDDDGVVADGGAEFIFLAPAQERERDDNKRVGFGNEIAAGAQVRNFELVGLNVLTEVAVPLDAEAGFGEFVLVFLEPGLPSREERVRNVCLFPPSVAGKRLIKLRHRDVIVERRPAVAVGSVGDNIHLALDEEELSPGPRMFDLQGGLEIVEIVPGKDLLNPRDVLLNPSRLQLVEMMIKWRDLGGADELVEILQHPGEMFIDRGELGGGLIRLRHGEHELHLELVALVALAFDHGRPALSRDHFGFHGDVAPEFGHIDLLPRDITRGHGRLNLDDFFDNFFHDLLDGDLDDLFHDEGIHFRRRRSRRRRHRRGTATEHGNDRLPKDRTLPANLDENERKNENDESQNQHPDDMGEKSPPPAFPRGAAFFRYVEKLLLVVHGLQGR